MLVIALGLIGLRIAKLVRVAGCLVTASDFDETRRCYVKRDGIQVAHPAALEDSVQKATKGYEPIRYS